MQWYGSDTRCIITITKYWFYSKLIRAMSIMIQHYISIYIQTLIFLQPQTNSFFVANPHRSRHVYTHVAAAVNLEAAK